MNFYLIDFENIKPDVEALNLPLDSHLYYFFGPYCKDQSVLLDKLRSDGYEVDIVQMARHGKNAVDFMIAVTLGRLFEREPGANYTIISRDSDFDNLIGHCVSAGYSITRSTGEFVGVDFFNKLEKVERKIERLHSSESKSEESLMKMDKAQRRRARLIQRDIHAHQTNLAVSRTSALGLLPVGNARVNQPPAFTPEQTRNFNNRIERLNTEGLREFSLGGSKRPLRPVANSHSGSGSMQKEFHDDNSQNHPVASNQPMAGDFPSFEEDTLAGAMTNLTIKEEPVVIPDTGRSVSIKGRSRWFSTFTGGR